MTSYIYHKYVELAKIDDWREQSTQERKLNTMKGISDVGPAALPINRIGWCKKTKNFRTTPSLLKEDAHLPIDGRIVIGTLEHPDRYDLFYIERFHPQFLSNTGD